MIGSYFGHVILFFMLSFASSNLLNGQLQDNGLFLSHLEDDTPDFDDKELSNYNDMAPRTLIAPRCSTGTSTWIVESTADAQALAGATNCSGGAFDVEWVGSIVVDETILVVNGTVLSITGIGPIATIHGGGTTNLFAVSNASLHLTNINVTDGNTTYGGAIEASSSELIFYRTIFFKNVATLSGGALYLSNNSTISISGESGFHKNHANDSGGAVYVGAGCSMSWAGEISFYGNTADSSGGAMYVSPMSNISWEGEARFTGNTATAHGGAMMASEGSRILWSGETEFNENIASCGGALCVWGAGKAIWEGKTLFTNNTSTGSGGAFCLYFGGSASWVGQSIFSNNTAYGWASGAIAAINGNSAVSWEGENTTFSGNTAELAGALIVSGPGSAASWNSNTHFFGNTADGEGGAFVVRNGATASWTGETSFSNNSANTGGALLVLDGSEVKYSGEAFFRFNLAWSDGGAIMVGNGRKISWSGSTSFVTNAAKNSGGAVYISTSSNASWGGKATYMWNTATSRGGAIMVSYDSSLAWSGEATFSSNVAYRGGAICVLGAGTVIWRGENVFINNNATRSGGALALRYAGEVRWEGNTLFSGNTANYHGGAITTHSDAVLSWAGQTIFSDNRADDWGGGALACFSRYVTWQGNLTTFSGNTGPDGGAILVGDDGGVSWATETHFVNNTATNLGGALLVRYGGLASWSGETIFWGNSADYGGALFIGDGVDLQWSGNTQFRSNRARSNGGAMASFCSTPNSRGSFRDSDSAIVINATTTFTNNTCGGDGGGMALLASLSLEVKTTNLTFDGNSAAALGGGMYISGYELATVFEGTTFIRNSANLGGGIYISVIGYEAFSTTFEGCNFVENTAATSGGAIISLTGYYSFIKTSFVGNTAAMGGALRLGGVADIENCTFVDNVSAENEGPAVSSIGVISNLTKSYFRNNTFSCDAGMYREFVEEGNFFHTICDGCDDVSYDQCCMEEQLTPECTSATEHSDSRGGDATIEDLDIDGGYWRASSSSTTILTCYNPEACLGGVTGSSDYCINGYEGPYCSVCSQGYMSNQGFTCSRCSNNSRSIVSTVLLAVVGMGVVVVITLYLISPNMEETRQEGLGRVVHFIPVKSLKIVINAWQILTQFSAVANVIFPGIYQRFLDSVASLNFDLTWMLSVGCIVDVDFHDRLLISTLGPILIMGFLAMTSVAAVRKNQGSEEALQNVRYKNVSMVLLLTFLVYSNVSATVFQMFACDDLDDGNTYLRADYRIQCDSTRHRMFQIYAGFMVIIYPVGISAMYAVLLFRSRGLLKDGTMRVDAQDVKSTSDLWKPYKPSRFYYEVIECIRRIALTGVVVFIYPNTAAQIAVALLMLFSFTVLSACLDPYESRWDSWLDRTGNIIVFASMFLALALKVDISDEMARGQKIFEAVLVAVHGGMILLVVVDAVTTAYALTIEDQNEPKPRYGVGRSLPSSIITSTLTAVPMSNQFSTVAEEEEKGKDCDENSAEFC